MDLHSFIQFSKFLFHHDLAEGLPDVLHKLNVHLLKLGIAMSCLMLDVCCTCR